MYIFRDFEHCPPARQGAVVALGNFDGVHLGHQEILQQSIASARSYGVSAAVMTFEPHPREFFAGERQRLRLCSFHQKITLMEALGIDTVFLVRFNRAFASLSAERFVDDVLQRQLAVKHVVTGYNFAFGKNRIGTTQYLADRARASGFGYTACPPVRYEGGNTISSSAIRTLLAAGDMAGVSALLGRPYVIEGRVRHGHKRGRTLGFPTANIALSRLSKPRYGVYAVRITIDGKKRDGVASIGINPTFDPVEPLLEVHVFDSNQELYGKMVQVECTAFLRDEVAFASVDLLKTQMLLDSQQAKKVLHAGT